MSFQPKSITKEHVEAAVAKIEEDQIELIPASKYSVVIDGKNYPPKEIMRYAHEQMNGEHVWEYSGGEPTHKFLRKMGYHIASSSSNLLLKDRYDVWLGENKPGLSDTWRKNYIDTFEEVIKNYQEQFEVSLYDLNNYKFELLIDLRAFKGFVGSNGVTAAHNFLEFESHRLCKTILSPWLDKYKRFLESEISSGSYDQSYKWETIKHFQDNWQDDHDDTNILQYLENSFIKPNNKLWSGNHYLPYAALLKFASADPSKVSEMFHDLFDEEKELDSRLKSFIKDSNALIQATGQDQKLTHYQDRRATMLYLTLKYPARYFFYKSSMFSSFCELTSLISKKELARVSKEEFSDVKYFNRVCEYIAKVLILEDELMSIYQTIIPKEFLIDDKKHTLTQDFIHTVITHLKPDKYTAEEIEQLFKEYLHETVPNSARNYISGITKINEVAIEEDLVSESIYEIQTKEGFDSILPRFNENAEWIERNKVGKNMFSAALKHYGNFLIELNHDQKTPISMKSQPLNQILYGPPGTGKTYNTINKALQIILGLGFNKDASRKDIKEQYDQLVDSGQIVFTTFHQSLSYEDFIEGIKPESIDGTVTYEVKPGIFKRIATRATSEKIAEENFENCYTSFLDLIKKNDGSLVLETMVHSKEFTVYENTKGNIKFHANTEKAYDAVIRKDFIKHYLETGVCLDWPSYIKAIGNYFIQNLGYKKEVKSSSKNYVLIIDEINRGNVSQVFGELITLIEPSKRQDNDENLEVILPYSGEVFSVPSNLYIIGTMNTADRSVEALDVALRRRFKFQFMGPKYDLEQLQHGLEGTDITAADLLKTINDRITYLKDEDHQIGHSYFMNVHSKDDLADTFNKNIIPLLQEYFYNDYGKIRLILGDGFVRKVEDAPTMAVNEQDEFLSSIRYKLLEINSENILDKVSSIIGG